MKFNKVSIISFIIIAIIINLIPNQGICSEEPGYCITHYGQPFKSVLISGETSNIPGDEFTSIMLLGALGTIGNLIIAFLLVMLIQYLLKKN